MGRRSETTRGQEPTSALWRGTRRKRRKRKRRQSANSAPRKPARGEPKSKPRRRRRGRGRPKRKRRRHRGKRKAERQPHDVQFARRRRSSSWRKRGLSDLARHKKEQTRRGTNTPRRRSDDVPQPRRSSANCATQRTLVRRSRQQTSW